MLPLACGSVRFVQPLESEPPRPREDRASAPTRATGTSASSDEDEHAGLPARVERGRALRAGEADAQPGDEQDEEHGHQGDAELVAAPTRDRPAATLSVLSGFEAKAQKATRPPQNALVASTATPRRRSGTTANHSAHPHGQRQQRAARVGEQEGDDEQSERRIGERADGRVARAPRAEPQARRPGGGGHEPHGVPVAERLAQAGVDLVGVQRAGEDLGQQRVAAHDHAGQHDAAQQRRPALREEPYQGDAGHHGGQVAERAVGLDPRARRARRPR